MKKFGWWAAIALGCLAAYQFSQRYHQPSLDTPAAVAVSSNPAAPSDQSSPAISSANSAPATQATSNDSAKPQSLSRNHAPATHHREDGRYYTNGDGNRVRSPVYAAEPPPGATAQCRDESYSFSQRRQGTCSHHGGVAQWL